MVKLTIRFFLFSLSLYILTGCVSSGKYQNIPDGADLTISTPERTILDWESVSAETKMVCAALINVLRKREETQFVRFFFAAREKVLEEEFDYEGFNVTRIDFTDIKTRKSGVDQTEGFVEGVFHFQDFVGRKTALYFMAEYMGSPYGIAINNAGVVQLPHTFRELKPFLFHLKLSAKSRRHFRAMGNSMPLHLKTV